MMDPNRDAFFRVPRTLHHTHAGLVDLPILYYDATNVIALFEAELSGATSLLEGTGLEPMPFRGKSALVAVSFYDYRRTTVGSYGEVGTAVFARRPGERGLLPGIAEMLVDPRKRHVGAWVVDLPVTTELACAAGRDLWGYPKFVTPITIALEGRSFHALVDAPDGSEPILQIQGEMAFGLPVPAFSLMTFSQLHGTLVRTPIDVRAKTHAHKAGTVRLRVGSSQHPMAAHLRTLALDGARPSILTVTTNFQSILHAGSRA
ncbi:MAG TPA: acetoacetate decarboxylase family protein [Polyangiaceae bacterium]